MGPRAGASVKQIAAGGQDTAGATSPDQDLHLTAIVRPDGTVRVSGFIEGMDGQRLIARPNEPAQASCADLDRDGTVGLTELVVPVSPPGQTREHVLLARVTPDREIDESGIYQVVVTDMGSTSGTVWAGDVRLKIFLSEESR